MSGFVTYSVTQERVSKPGVFLMDVMFRVPVNLDQEGLTQLPAATAKPAYTCRLHDQPSLIKKKKITEEHPRNFGGHSIYLRWSGPSGAAWCRNFWHVMLLSLAQRTTTMLIAFCYHRFEVRNLDQPCIFLGVLNNQCILTH